VFWVATTTAAAEAAAETAAEAATAAEETPRVVIGFVASSIWSKNRARWSAYLPSGKPLPLMRNYVTYFLSNFVHGRPQARARGGACPPLEMYKLQLQHFCFAQKEP